MKPNEYLNACKMRLNIQSDYELAKRLGVSGGAISEIQRGIRGIPLDLAFRIAITLELDPAEVVADLEGQSEKNPKKREFWNSFVQRARAAVVLLACTLALSVSGIYGNGAATHGGFNRRGFSA